MLMLAVSAVTLFPIFYLFLGSFSDVSRIFVDGINLTPRLSSLTLENYEATFNFSNGIYLQWYANSFLIMLMFTTGALVLTSMVGYGLGAYQFRGRNVVFVLVLIVMMIPIEILMLPLYSLAVRWGIMGTKAGVVLPFMVSASAVFFFRQYTTGLPLELMDAGRIDGATEFGIFYRIMVPLMRPAFGAMTILMAMTSWNQFVWPLIVLRENRNFTLPIGLASLISPYGNNYQMLLAGAVMAVVPVILVFIFNQKSFVSGLAAGGVKG
ncbi:MAG TPA: carbohydrate ABC transporter permease [Candidatus Limnocylindria bacterium]|nr:carbohydrate ABC transporter permease [Candidatus Limnocylindria bacterium]